MPINDLHTKILEKIFLNLDYKSQHNFIHTNSHFKKRFEAERSTNNQKRLVGDFHKEIITWVKKNYGGLIVETYNTEGLCYSLVLEWIKCTMLNNLSYFYKTINKKLIKPHKFHYWQDKQTEKLAKWNDLVRQFDHVTENTTDTELNNFKEQADQLDKQSYVPWIEEAWHIDDLPYPHQKRLSDLGYNIQEISLKEKNTSIYSQLQDNIKRGQCSIFAVLLAEKASAALAAGHVLGLRCYKSKKSKHVLIFDPDVGVIEWRFHLDVTKTKIFEHGFALLESYVKNFYEQFLTVKIKLIGYYTIAKAKVNKVHINPFNMLNDKDL